MSTADGYVLPKPGVPKTLGILNIIFGVILVIMGFCTIGSLIAAPALMNFAEKTTKDVQAKAEANQTASLKALDDREAAAKTEEEKKAIQQERATIANQPKVKTPDMSAAMDVLKNPTIMGVSYGGIISGLILQILLLISGIGLIRLTPWGRSMAIWWAGLQIFQVIVLLAINILLVQPINKPMTDQQIANLEAQAKAEGAGQAEAGALQLTKTMASMAIPLAVGQSLSGMIYPIVLLILLNSAGARAACLPKKPEGFESF